MVAGAFSIMEGTTAGAGEGKADDFQSRDVRAGTVDSMTTEGAPGQLAAGAAEGKADDPPSRDARAGTFDSAPFSSDDERWRGASFDSHADDEGAAGGGGGGGGGADAGASADAGGELDFFQELEQHLETEYRFGEDARAFMFQNASTFMPLALATPPLPAGAAGGDTYKVDTGGEQPLEFYAAYQGFRDLYERKILAFLQRKGVDEKQFMDMCDDAQEGAPEAEGGNREFIELLLASLEYDQFVDLMVVTCHQVMAAQAAQAGGEGGEGAPADNMARAATQVGDMLEEAAAEQAAQEAKK